MSSPKQLSIHQFKYDLPDDKIAQRPLNERDSSKLLIYNNQTISESIFNKLDEVLSENDLLIFNETKVVHARLIFYKETGSRIEIFCLEPFLIKETAQAFAQKKSAEWVCMLGNAKRWKHDEILKKEITLNETAFVLSAEKLEQNHDSFTIRLSWNNNMSFAEVIHYAGLLPLPPYMNRDAEDEDEERYQTVYAKYNGSVAAPTAGLHFTPKVFEKLRAKKIETDFLTLHVGAGTFKPVKADLIQDHEMHEERLYISLSLIEKIAGKIGKHKIIPVGTTSLRSLESLYWFGVKILRGETIDDGLYIAQWVPYENEELVFEVKDALEAVISWIKKKQLTVLSGSTKIIIAPPYQMKIADALITNFHQPESTLLLLVSAFIGEDWQKVYHYALEHRFRFLSYGDSSILFRK